MNKLECFRSAAKAMEEEKLATSDEDDDAIGVSGKGAAICAFLQLFGMRLFDAGIYEPVANMEIDYDDTDDSEFIVTMYK